MSEIEYTMLARWLAHPLMRGLSLDDPHTTESRRQVVRSNRFLYRIYEEWYAALIAALPAGKGAVVELGSGAGFLAERLPGLITSEVFFCSHVNAVLDGCTLPLVSDSLRGIVMTDVLHHVSNVRRFLAEAARCVRKGGVVTMIEPWVTPWSRFIYQRFHHEPFRPEVNEWEFPSSGPLSGANGALPWIIFSRDRVRFQTEFPNWQIDTIQPCMPFRYLVSGGVSRRALMPSWSFKLWRELENVLSMNTWAMFAQIVLHRV